MTSGEMYSGVPKTCLSLNCLQSLSIDPSYSVVVTRHTRHQQHDRHGDDDDDYNYYYHYYYSYYYMIIQRTKSSITRPRKCCVVSTAPFLTIRYDHRWRESICFGEANGICENENSTIANRSRVSCAQTTSRAYRPNYPVT